MPKRCRHSRVKEEEYTDNPSHCSLRGFHGNECCPALLIGEILPRLGSIGGGGLNAVCDL